MSSVRSLLFGTLAIALMADFGGHADEPKPPAAEKKALYVAVGYGGRRVSSRDGQTWEDDTEWAANGGDDNNCLFSVAFGKGQFVAVGGGASAGHILVTRDGKEWKQVHKAKNRVCPVLFDGKRFLAGQGRSLLVSDDGATWKEGATLDYKRGIYLRRGAAGNGVFVVCGDCDVKPNAPRNGWVAASADGTTIDHFDTEMPNTRALAFGAGRFVLVGESGMRATSTDGKKWERADDADDQFHWVFWTGKEFLLNAKTSLYSSPDGLKWTKAGKPVPAEPRVAGNGPLVGSSWKTNLWLSDDGRTWKKTTTEGTNAITAMAYGVPVVK